MIRTWWLRSRVRLRPSSWTRWAGISSALQTDAVGILDIRSVYDWDGIVVVPLAGDGGVAACGQCRQLPATSAARFLRIEKPVSLGDPDLGSR